MNQVSSTAATSRPSGAAEAPEVTFVLRRYVWLIVIGTILGTALAGGLWAWLYRTAPRYTASVTFQVLPPPVPPGRTTLMLPATPTQEEITRFIRRQMLYIKSEGIIERALQQDEFQHDYQNPTSSAKSRWLSENVVQAKKRLREDMEITPVPTSDVFLISMTAKDNVEAARLVNAIARVYMDSLTNDAKQNTNKEIEELGEMVKNQDAQVKSLQTALADFRTINNIDAITPRYTVQLAVLGELDKELTKAQGLVLQYGSIVESMKQQVATNTLQLSPEAQFQYVDNDPELRQLSASRLALLQEKAALVATGGVIGTGMRNVDARISEVDRLLAERKSKAEADARLKMQAKAQADFAGAVGQMEFLKKERDKKDAEVRDLDKWLVQAKQQEDAVRAQQAVLDDLRKDYTVRRLGSSTDDSRVRRMGGEAIPPEEISWPMWYKFIPVGFGLGLLFSFGVAYLFELTNTRIRTPHDITRTLQMPLLGFVPDQEDDRSVTGELSTSIRTAPSSMIAESFRQIRGRLMAEGDGNPMKSLLVASIAPGGGATTVASNIANGMALNEMRVLLVDANFYRPGLKNSYKNLPGVGLADVIASPEKLESAIVESSEMSNLHVMGAGNVGSANPAEMLESKAFREVLDALKSRYDIVVFDGAPLSLVSDSVALGARVDGVIAVVRAGEVSRGTVARVREQLRQVRAKFLGVVLNAAQTHGAGYFKENYRTFYKYAGQGAKANGATAGVH
jgi:capsular exopolysaccharide synthesis family protein